jgi:uncharacterized protein (DUF1330 family)
MAELHQVQINENTEEENITLEQQAELQEQAGKLAEKQAEEVQEETPERPEWLDEKFESPEDLAKAYNELQKKQSSKPKKQTKVDESEITEEITSNTSSAIEQAQEYFAENGDISDELLDNLETAGIPRNFVESYIAGQTALVSTEVATVKDSIGGEGQYEAMTEWAMENLTDTDIDAFDDVVSNGTVEQAKMAVQGMFARFVAAGGKAPVLSQGGTAGNAVKPFASAAQVTEAMKDARYQNDPAYRQTVENRLAVTTAF